MFFCDFQIFLHVVICAFFNRVKNFADQRIRVKAKGRHAATKNPVKQLQDRGDLRSDTDEVRSLSLTISERYWESFMGTSMYPVMASLNFKVFFISVHAFPKEAMPAEVVRGPVCLVIGICESAALGVKTPTVEVLRP